MAETSHKYIEAIGRRKTSIARVRLTEASKMSFVINDRELADYFPTAELQRVVMEPFTEVKEAGKYKISVLLKGGGISSQAVALRLGISRALLDFDKELRGKLKKAGFLKRDPRAKERRKFGLKKARKAPQWSKR
ncbi:MAG: rpsI [Candidatus Paceibacter sp.]|jgi:small subunit ribosomal protein S9|nr:rpsI [Candidatus Paceibacter sp.]